MMETRWEPVTSAGEQRRAEEQRRSRARERRRLGVWACALLLTLLPLPTAAQTIVGRVVDELRGTGVAGAAVSLLDREGEARAQALADSVGRFVITPPAAGEYELVATRVGYRPGRSPLLALVMEGTARVDLLLQPAPIGLEGLDVAVDVSAEAAAQLEIAGVEPRDLGNRWITRADIEAIEIKQDVGTVLEWRQIGGMRVVRPENLTSGSDPIGLCVSLVRARTGQGTNRCALAVVDGIPQTNDALLHLDPESVEAMAVLNPTEGAFMYGARGEAGVVMVWTRR